MSLETKTRIICDGCGAAIEGEPSILATDVAASYWDAKRKAKAQRWIVQERSYRRDAHYCHACADKPQKPVKNPERPKKCQECREITKSEKSDTRYRICMGYNRCETCGWKRVRWQYK